MDIIELKKKIVEIEIEFSEKKRSLIVDYLQANNTYKVGDNFTDHIGSIKIEKILFDTRMTHSNPSCVYHGTELKKDGTPKKNPKTRNAYQFNEIKKTW